VTNFTDLTNEELDKLAAEMMEWYADEAGVYYDKQTRKGVNFFTPNGDRFEVDRWNPTHPDSNQAERYLFPKLKEYEIYMDVEFLYQQVRATSIERNCPINFILPVKWEDPDQINRTKVIAALAAWEKINE